MGSGLVIAGQRVVLPGIDVTNFHDDPRLKLASGDKRRRSSTERAWVHVVVVHTTAGIPGGKDLRPQLVKPGLGPSTGGGQRVVASWTHDTRRPGGAHLVVDQDARIYCCADLALEAAYHASEANGCSVGIEVVQGRGEAEVYEWQLDAAAKLAMWVCMAMPTPIQWQVPSPYRGPSRRLVSSMTQAPYLQDVVGIVGHRDLTHSRGRGDPGDALMDDLVRLGCERHDLDAYDDLVAWKKRQVQLGVVPDGVPGPKTVQAIRSLGEPSGIWRRIEIKAAQSSTPKPT